MNTNTLTVSSFAQAAIFEHELKGQISDGMWENSSGGSYRQWCSAKVVVGENPGRNFYVSKDRFNFASKDLVDCVGERMILQARIAILYGMDKVHDYEYLFGSGIDKACSLPKYEGKYYDDLRSRLAPIDLGAIHTAVTSHWYGKKELMADLKALKVAARNFRLN